jgi:predicted nucleic acid-binding protein
MTALYFVDTNVFVYAHDASEPIKQPIARQRIVQLWDAQTGRISTQVLSELHTTLTRKPRFAWSGAAAWNEVEALMAWEPQALDVGVLKQARAIEHRHKLSWWDSLVVAAAEVQGCAVLLTEDLQDGARYGSVRVENPFKLGVREPHAEYTIATKPISRHPPRGRPKGKKTKRPAKRTAAG